LLLLQAGVSVAPVAEAPEAADSPMPQRIEFFVNIQPILATHCIKCHGADRRSGGLRLDNRAGAAAGGDSGRPILGGTLETNELYQRIASDERTYRMPKNAEPLSSAEKQWIRDWVEQGSFWPDNTGSTVGASQSFVDRWLHKVAVWQSRYSPEIAYLRPFAVGFIVAQLALLLIARCRRAYLADRPWAHGRARAICQRCARLSSRELVAAWALMMCALVIAGMRGHQLRLDGELAKWNFVRPMTSGHWPHTVYGYPPRPFRPDQPKQLGGTYYRGNCERNPALFNGGNYLTSTFKLDLCDQEHEQVHVGDSIPHDGFLVRLEIIRAPHTADVLFSKDIMDSVFLSETFYGTDMQDIDDSKPVVHLQTLEEAQRWVAYYPVKSSQQGTFDAIIYIYTGRVEKDQIRGEPHYAIQFNLKIADDKVAEESDLWMNSFGNGAFLDPQPPEKLPYREWFDTHPIPEITGENTKDPKLLGVEEYVRKGLLPPEAAQPPQEPAQQEPADK
jgi:hypothetical protein